MKAKTRPVYPRLYSGWYKALECVPSPPDSPLNPSLYHEWIQARVILPGPLHQFKTLLFYDPLRSLQWEPDDPMLNPYNWLSCTVPSLNKKALRVVLPSTIRNSVVRRYTSVNTSEFNGGIPANAQAASIHQKRKLLASFIFIICKLDRQQIFLKLKKYCNYNSHDTSYLYFL